MSWDSLSRRFARIRGRLDDADPLRVVFVNDCGFIAGAGVATRRQALSLLAGGHNVGVVCSLENPEPVLSLRGAPLQGHWLGMTSLPELNGRQGPTSDPAEIRSRVVDAVARCEPDLAITGNLHWTAWPVEICGDLTEAGIPTIAYMHDCHFITGRCVYPGLCCRYESGCGEECPTATQYPMLPPDQIAPAQRMRHKLFAGHDGVPIAGNSNWVCDVARRGLGPKAEIGLVPLGLDDSLFSTIDRQVARRLLDVPQGLRVVLFGAVDVADKRKGGPLMKEVCQLLSARSALRVCAFGHNSEYLPAVHGFGHINDERVLPLMYSACNIKVSFALEESFGQTCLEAAACARPVVARRAGGIVDIVVHGVNGRIIDSDDPAVFAEACLDLVYDDAQCERFGLAGREIVMQRHTLSASREGLERWIRGFAEKRFREPEAGSALTPPREGLPIIQ